MKITQIVPWLVRVDRVYWGEFLFVEVRTDAGISGWGEITTTTKPANRAVAAILRQLNGLLVGDDPTRIEQIWHKTFRSFTYMGSRGAASHVVSGIDIALWDIVGKLRGLPVYEMLGGPVRDDVLIYTHPDQSKFTSRARSRRHDEARLSPRQYPRRLRRSRRAGLTAAEPLGRCGVAAQGERRGLAGGTALD